MLQGSRRHTFALGEFSLFFESMTIIKKQSLAKRLRSRTADESKKNVFILDGLLADEKEANIVQCYYTRLKTT
jgi:hypothetical protein